MRIGITDGASDCALFRRQLQPTRSSGLQGVQITSRSQLARRVRRWVFRRQQVSVLQDALGLPGDGFAGVDEVYLRAGQCLQDVFGKDIVGAAQHQRIDGSIF